MEKSMTPGFFNPCFGFSQAPEHVEGGRVCDMREEKVVLIT
jgi:hypothetical protein